MRIGFGMRYEGFGWNARDLEGLGYARTCRGLDLADRETEGGLSLD